MARTLLIISPEVARLTHSEQQRREAADESPRATLFDDTVATDIIDGVYVRSLKGLAALLYRPVPAPLVQALEAFRRRHSYDVVLTWDDRVALLYAFLLTITRSRTRHVAMLNWMLPSKKRMALRLVYKHMDRIIVWGEMHKELLAEFVSIERSRITCVPWLVDHQYWRPITTSTDMICAVGNSRRDYQTLIEAVSGTDITCRLVTHVLDSKRRTPDYGATRRGLPGEDVAENIIVGGASPTELRDVYARSRFVVVPLIPGFRDNGITTATEAMAMGKAVVCSRIYGMIDVVEDGVTGIMTPPGDAEAMRNAILYLWNNPDVAERMGAEGRRRAESVYALDKFAASVKQVVEEVAQGKPQAQGAPATFQAEARAGGELAPQTTPHLG